MINPINRCSPTVLFTQISRSSVDDDQLKMSAQTAILAHGQYEWWMRQSPCNSTSSLLSGYSAALAVLRARTTL